MNFASIHANHRNYCSQKLTQNYSNMNTRFTSRYIVPMNSLTYQNIDNEGFLSLKYKHICILLAYLENIGIYTSTFKILLVYLSITITAVKKCNTLQPMQLTI